MNENELAKKRLYYFNARYYDATIGRFINVDPIQDGLNWYVYCNNNPLNFKDPTGLQTNNEDGSITFNNKNDELKNGATEAGFDNWNHSLDKGKFTNQDGNDVSDYVKGLYDKSGKWLGGENDSLEGITLNSFDTKQENLEIEKSTNNKEINWNTVRSGFEDVAWGTGQAAASIVLVAAGTASAETGVGPIACYGAAYWYGMQAIGSFTMGLSKVALGFQGIEPNINIPAGIDLLTPGVPSSSINFVKDFITGRNKE
ncbi:MAG: RHS repeat-associated core domain protein [Candidatus Daviesbacteria bacterium GW2011_GWB1_36_5]|uniref:RHS repeat-associated core domain protein n=1 Tax=Candidatus Daviesbacteria bacterium GW2011_GWB1_36_5 TaxID=1618426 RepID=A0A0G0H8I7_9BACT|nr:MAG: RHS repeat-associated core domain protein [Candidatus Daviesbacteria bacterium GW2011_GWB1_36_5]